MRHRIISSAGVGVLSQKEDVNKRFCERCGLPSTTPLCAHCSTLWVAKTDYNEFIFYCPKCGKKVDEYYREEDGLFSLYCECGWLSYSNEAQYTPALKFICRRCGVDFYSPDWLKLHEKVCEG